MSKERIEIGTVVEVADAKRSINELRQSIEDSKTALQGLNAGTADYNRVVEDLIKAQNSLIQAQNASVDKIGNLEDLFDNTAKATSGLVSGFNAVKGSMALLGSDSQKLDKSFKKLMIGMQVAQDIKNLTGSVKSASTAMSIFNTVIRANPIMAIATALLAAVTAFKLFSDAVGEADANMKELKSSELSFNNIISEGEKDLNFNLGLMKAKGATTKELIVAEQEYTKETIKLIEARIDALQMELNFYENNKGMFWDFFGLGKSSRIQDNIKEQLESLRGQVGKHYKGLKALNDKYTFDEVKEDRLKKEELEKANEAYYKKNKSLLEADAKAHKAHIETVSNMMKGIFERERADSINKDLNNLADNTVAKSKMLNDLITKGTFGISSLMAKINSYNYEELDKIEDINERLEAKAEMRKDELEDIQKLTQLYSDINNYNNDLLTVDANKKKLGKELNEITKESESSLRALYELRNLESKVERFNTLKAISDFKAERDALNQVKTDLNKEVGELKQKLVENKEDGEELTLERRIELTEEYNRKLIDQQKLEIDIFNTKQAIEQAKRDAINGTLQTMGDAFIAASEHMKQGTAIHKALAKTGTIISSIAAAQNIFESTAKIPIVGKYLAPIAAASALAQGAKRVRDINKIKIPGGDKGSSGGSGIPQPQILQSMPNIQQTVTKMDGDDLDVINKDNKVYVVESDISKQQNRVKVAENEASF